MRRYVVLANDPGGFDSVFPVAVALKNIDNTNVTVKLTGQAAEKKPQYKSDKADIERCLEELISKHVDFVLVTGTSWGSSVELEAIQLCKEKGIKTVSILDYWCNYKERFFLDGKYVYPDFLFVMDTLAFNEAEKDGIPASIMEITGNPGLDHYVKRTKRKRKVLFVSQPLSVINKEYEGYTEFEAFEGVLKASKELNLAAYIKFHPKETDMMVDMYHDMSVEGDLEEIVFNYDVVVGMTTMGLLQCSIMGVPVISYQPGLLVDDKCIVNKLGITEGAFSYDELLERLNQIIAFVNRDRMPFWYDGKSTERCINSIMNI